MTTANKNNKKRKDFSVTSSSCRTILLMASILFQHYISSVQGATTTSSICGTYDDPCNANFKMCRKLEDEGCKNIVIKDESSCPLEYGCADRSVCGSVDDECMDQQNYKDCRLLEDSGCSNVVDIVGSCPKRFSCADDTYVETTEQIILVGSEKVDCDESYLITTAKEEQTQHKCFMIKMDETDAEWKLLHDENIAFFNWESGYEYALLVRVVPYEEDSVTYSLLSVVAKKPNTETRNNTPEEEPEEESEEENTSSTNANNSSSGGVPDGVNMDAEWFWLLISVCAVSALMLIGTVLYKSLQPFLSRCTNENDLDSKVEIGGEVTDDDDTEGGDFHNQDGISQLTDSNYASYYNNKQNECMRPIASCFGF